MDKFIYDGRSGSLQKALDVHSQGGEVICYRCGAKLLILPDWKSAIPHEKRPGIYCPVNEKHICEWFFLLDRREQLWKKFNEWQKNQETGG